MHGGKCAESWAYGVFGRDRWRVPLSSNELLKLLEEKLPARDGIYFLPDQVAEYEGWRGQGRSAKKPAGD